MTESIRKTGMLAGDRLIHVAVRRRLRYYALCGAGRIGVQLPNTSFDALDRLGCPQCAQKVHDEEPGSELR